MTQTLERVPNVSPLLRGPVIEKDYTKGIEDQINQSAAPEPAPTPEPQQPEPDPQTTTGEPSFHDGFKPDDTKGFSFEEPTDGSDIGGGEAPGFELSGTSAKAFSNMAGDLIKVYVPQITYTYAKVDLNSIKAHIDNGNIDPRGYDTFQNVNQNTLDSLQFEDDEIKMWKKAFKEYLEYKNMQVANPETAFWIATAALIGVHGIKAVQCHRQNAELIRQLMMSFNPDFFNSYSAKTGKAPEKEDDKEEPKEEKKKL